MRLIFVLHGCFRYVTEQSRLLCLSKLRSTTLLNSYFQSLRTPHCNCVCTLSTSPGAALPSSLFSRLNLITRALSQPPGTALCLDVRGNYTTVQQEIQPLNKTQVPLLYQPLKKPNYIQPPLRDTGCLRLYNTIQCVVVDEYLITGTFLFRSVW